MQDYTIVIPANGGGLVAAEQVNDAQTAGKVITAPFAVTAMPNPSRTTFTLAVNGNENEAVEIRVLDMYGRVVHQAKGATNRQYIFGQNFTTGTYIAQVIQGKNIKTIKLVKSR